ncbi:CAP domain-containing protein [Patescibacteria group bacterium]|nr:CAP domain-containing protein [Patescibacteria group bacterium]
MLNLAQIKQPIARYLAKAKTAFLAVFVPNEENCFLPEALKQKYLFWYGTSLLIVKIALISLVLILPSTNFFSAIAADRLVSLINQERQSRNLSALAINSSLNSVADLKVNDMLAKDYFDHTSPQGVSPWFWFKQIGYNFAFAGENLAMGFTATDAVFQAWMNSASHRDNILNPNYQEMGLAIKAGQIQNHADTLAVLVFGKQQAATPKTQVAQKTPSATASPKIQASIAPSPTAPRGERSEPYGALPAILSPTPNASPEQIELKTVLGEQPQNTSTAGQSANAPVKIGYAPRVLGAFASKSDEIGKSLYLYFTLFLAMALAVNIFVKIRIQYWPTILATTLIIMMSTALIFI